MSNKTSDKNVANIEDDVNELKRLLYSDTLTQYAKRKLVNYYEQRIQELEEERNQTQIMSLYYVKENYIPKQTIIDKIEELKKQISIDICIENNLEKHYELKYKIDILQELLEGEN